MGRLHEAQGRHTVLSLTVPSMATEVAGSSPMLPEQKTSPLYLIACENCGRGLGALSVRTLSILLILMVM